MQELNTPTFPTQETHYFNETETSQEHELKFAEFCSFAVKVLNSLHLELQNDTEQTSLKHEQELVEFCQSGNMDRSYKDDLNEVDQGGHDAKLAGTEFAEQCIYNYECTRCGGVFNKLCQLRLCGPASPSH